MTETTGSGKLFRLPWWIFLLGFLTIAAIMNWEEHRAHILGVLPYLFLLSCPFMHFFMHSGHGENHNSHSETDHLHHSIENKITDEEKS